jgi:hypothetical protein
LQAEFELLRVICAKLEASHPLTLKQCHVIK